MPGSPDLSGDVLVTVWFDYTCPHCHVGLGRLDSLSGEVAFTIDRRPYLLRPHAPINSVLAQDRSVEAQSLTHESPVRRPPLAPLGEKPAAEPFSSRSLSTVLVHEATAFAREQGRDREFYLETAGEYWERGSDLGSIYTLRRSASRARLDWESMWPKLESGHYRPWVLEEHRAAVEQGVKGVPSYFIGGKMYTGDVELDALRGAVEGADG